MLKLMVLAFISGGSKFVQLLKNQQVMQFLIGLNDEFKTGGGNILMIQPIPDLNKTYRLILQEEQERDAKCA